MSTPSTSIQSEQQQQQQCFFLPLTAPIVSSKVLQRNPPPYFLSLAPATSASYPRAPASRVHERAENIPASIDMAAPMPRRSSASSVSSTNGYRVLKLGPVHWGEHLGDHKDDFHDSISP